jgi:O-antigen/teichoic acid export membrane protein
VSTRARQATHTVAAYAARVILGGLSGVVITRALGPEGRGDYAILLAVSTIAGCIGHLSIEQSHASLWARVRNRDAIAANGLLLGPVVGTLAALATAGVVIGLAPGAAPVPGHGLLAVALLTIPCNMTALYLNNVLVLRARVEWVNRAAVLGAAVQCAMCFLLAATGRLSVAWAVTAWAMCVAAPLVVLIPAGRLRLRERDLSLARLALRIGLRHHTGVVALYLLLRVDVLILGGLTSTVAVGLYSLAVSLMELTRAAADSVAQIALPDQMDADPASAFAFTVRMTRLTTLLSMASVGLMCGAAPLLIPLIYGSAFTGAVAPLLALAPGLCVVGATRPIQALLLRLDRPLVMSSISMTALVVASGLNLALIPRFGVVGCAVAASLGYALLAGLQVAWFMNATRTPLRRLVPGRADARPLVATLRAARLTADRRGDRVRAPRSRGEAGG